LASFGNPLKETYKLIKDLKVTSQVYSDHYTNYVHVNGKLPKDKDTMLQTIETALQRDEKNFREVYVGTE
jgi:hypothetical protein